MNNKVGKRIILDKKVYSELLNNFDGVKTSDEQSEQELLGLVVENNINRLKELSNLDKETLTLLKLVSSSAKIIDKEDEILAKLKDELKKIYNEVGGMI